MSPVVNVEFGGNKLAAALAGQSNGLKTPDSQGNESEKPKATIHRLRPPEPVRMTRDDREFLPAALEILEQPPSPIRMSLIWVFAVFTIAALLWAWFGRIDIHAIAQGRIQPTGRTKVVQPAEGGKVVAIFVGNGSKVKAGDVLVELDSTDSSVDRDIVTSERHSALAEIARRRQALAIVASEELSPRAINFDKEIPELARKREEAMLRADITFLAAAKFSLESQIDERRAQQQRFHASVTERDKLVTLLAERVAMRQLLVDRQSGARAAVIDAMQQQQTEAATLASEIGQITELERAITSLRSRIAEGAAQFIMDQTQKLSEAEKRADKASQDLIKAQSKDNRTRLYAPVDGTVGQLAVSTKGQIVTSGQALLTLVPSDGSLEIEALIQNKDVGFVREGQEVTIKVEAFPFTRFGTLTGSVIHVSQDAMDEREAGTLADPIGSSRSSTNSSALNSTPRVQSLVFPTKISLTEFHIKTGDKSIPLTPGMAVTVEVKTGERRVIDYILSPLREVASEAARER